MEREWKTFYAPDAVVELFPFISFLSSVFRLLGDGVDMQLKITEALVAG